MNHNNWKWFHSVGLVAIIVVTYLVGLLMPTSQILLMWLLTLMGLVIFTMLASHSITGLFWLGWLIDEQYRMSLSRLQMFLWTVVVLSAFFTAGRKQWGQTYTFDKMTLVWKRCKQHQ